MTETKGTDKLPEGTARIAVAGAGWWSQGHHLPQLGRNPRAAITAIIEPCAAPRSTLNPDMKKTQDLGLEYNVPIFSTVDEFLESEAKKHTDGIIVASNHATHSEIGMKALRAGLHILMEKPMTTDPVEAIDLVKACSASDKLFMINHTANFRENAKQAHNLVQQGRVGKIQHVTCYMGTALQWLLEDPSNVGWVKPSGKMLGNGFGWGQLSHSLSWVYFVTGLTPKSVSCAMQFSEKTGADLFDSAVIRCECGATISLTGVGTLPFESYEQTSKQIDNKIYGTEGMIMYSGEDYHPSSGNLVLKRHDGNHQKFDGFHFEQYGADGDGPDSLQAFITGCIGKPVFNGASVTVGLKSVQTLEAMYRSALSQKLEPVVSMSQD